MAHRKYNKACKVEQVAGHVAAGELWNVRWLATAKATRTTQLLSLHFSFKVVTTSRKGNKKLCVVAHYSELKIASEIALEYIFRQPQLKIAATHCLRVFNENIMASFLKGKLNINSFDISRTEVSSCHKNDGAYYIRLDWKLMHGLAHSSF